MATGAMVRASCLKVLTDLVGQPVHVDTIVERTNFTPTQVKASLNHMVKDGLPIEVINKSVVWKFVGEVETEATAAPANRVGELWEVVGHVKSGILIRDESGVIYVAKEME